MAIKNLSWNLNLFYCKPLNIIRIYMSNENPCTCYTILKR